VKLYLNNITDLIVACIAKTFRWRVVCYWY